MKLSISKKVGIIVSASLVISLGCMFILFFINENRSKLNSTKIEAHNISQLLLKSITFSMLNGNSNVLSFIKKVKDIENLSALSVIPTNKVIDGSENKMDKSELSVLKSKKPLSFTENFKNTPVLRNIELIKAEKGCKSCHDTYTGQPMAVVSIRYSLKEMYSSIASQRLLCIALAIITILVAFFISMYLINKKIVADLNISIGSIQNLSEGDTEEVKLAERSDEIGKLNQAVMKLQTSMDERSYLGTDFANGNFEKEIVLLSPKDSLGKAFQIIKDSLKKLIDDLNELTRSALEGNLGRRADSSFHKGEFKHIINGINSTLDAVIQPIKESSKVLEKMTEGDLTVRVVGEYKGDHQIIKNSINNLSDSLSHIIKDVSEAVKNTAGASHQISSSTEEMAAGSLEQSQQTMEVAGAIEQMTKTILNTSKNSSSAAEAAKNSGIVAKAGGKVVNDTIIGMNRVAEVVKQSAATVQTLGDSSNEIGEIIQVIDDIADQTNLLALNAAIEAARAGEQGRGFAVVADEVRKLAERTTKATKEIATMIKQIQKDTEEAVDSMKRGTDEVEKGKEFANKAGHTLNQIINGTEEVLNISGQVAAASEEQSKTSEQISKSIEAISSVTEQSSAAIQQIAKTAEDLNKLTNNLESLIKKFKINDRDDQPKYSVRQNGKLVENI